MTDSPDFEWTDQPHAMVSLYTDLRNDKALRFCRNFADHQPLISVSNTGNWLRDNGVPVVRMEECYASGASLDHRVLTLDDRVHKGILAELDNPEHMAYLEELGALPIGAVIGGFYPFGVDPDDFAHGKRIKDQIDIGGPTMAHAGVKADRIVVVHAADYDHVIAELDDAGELSPMTRWDLDCKVFETTGPTFTNIGAYMRANPPAA